MAHYPQISARAMYHDIYGAMTGKVSTRSTQLLAKKVYSTHQWSSALIWLGRTSSPPAPPSRTMQPSFPSLVVCSSTFSELVPPSPSGTHTTFRCVVSCCGQGAWVFLRWTRANRAKRAEMDGHCKTGGTVTMIRACQMRENKHGRAVMNYTRIGTT